MIVYIRGGGDLASGVALRLFRTGLKVVIAELPKPLAVRRNVSFAEAIYANEVEIEGISGRRVSDPTDSLRIMQVFARSQIPVLIDPEGVGQVALHPTVVVDGRMRKEYAKLDPQPVQLLIGLGPGFEAGKNCHAVIETNRGHLLGRVYWQGKPEADTGIPDVVAGINTGRVLRSPADGLVLAHVEIGQVVEAGQVVAEVTNNPVIAPISGVLRGIVHPTLEVQAGWKIGDIDPRADPQYCSLVSDKALAVGGGVLEAILSKPHLRPILWGQTW